MRLMYLVVLFPLFVVVTQGKGQTSPGTDPGTGSASPPGLQPRPAIPPGPDYRIGAGDVLRVSVWEEPQFTTSAVVRPDGKISIPLVSDLSVSGMTPGAAQNLLTDQLTRFVKHPQVTVIVEEIHSRIVYVTGEIQHPGAYPLIGPTNVVQLIARAGGPTEFAKKKDVYVLHQDGGLRIKVNYQMVLAGKHLEENIGLNPGDTVVVP
jgi:polysaccharide export outer membrane protein